MRIGTFYHGGVTVLDNADMVSCLQPPPFAMIAKKFLRRTETFVAILTPARSLIFIPHKFGLQKAANRELGNSLDFISKDYDGNSDSSG